jgi:hypothetical protein
MFSQSGASVSLVLLLKTSHYAHFAKHQTLFKIRTLSFLSLRGRGSVWLVAGTNYGVGQLGKLCCLHVGN